MAARDYEDIPDIDSMDDEELGALIRQEYGEYPGLDIDRIDIRIEGGRVTLSGRVGTERELQEFEHVLTDVIGVRDVENELVVDELVRQDSPEAADLAAAELAQEKGPTGAGADRTSETAEHLMRDTAGEQYGTDDVGEAVERGYTYQPPTGPIQEGTRSRENH